MAVKTATFGTAGTETNFKVMHDNKIYLTTLSSSEYVQGYISFNLVEHDTTRAWKKANLNVVNTVNVDLYLVNASGSGTKLFRISGFNSQGTMIWTPNVSDSAFNHGFTGGQALYLWANADTATHLTLVQYYGQITVSIPVASNSYTRVYKDNIIYAADYTQTGKSARQGDPISATNTSGTAMSGTAYASTFNSSVLGL